MKKTIYFIIGLFAIIASSCDDYLEEVNYSDINQATSFESEENFEYLVNACYVPLRMWYGKENGWDYTETGTDLYMKAADNRAPAYCDYDNWLTGETPLRNSNVWRQIYAGLNSCNVILKYMDDVPYTDAPKKERRRAEVLFLRAHYLWWIVETWGGVHFQTEPQETKTNTATRRSVEEFYEQIFKDLLLAEEIFEENEATIPSGSEYGRVHKAAVQAMLARVYLTRGDYANAYAFANAVISNPEYSLIGNWGTLWDINNMHNSENIWTINYSYDLLYTTALFLRDDDNTELHVEANGIIQRRGGNQGLVMWAIRYENTGWGLARAMPYERGFNRWQPTRHLIDLYDETVDQRWGSFRTSWAANSEAAISKWPATVYIDGVATPVDTSKVGKPLFSLGDTALVLYKHAWPEPRAKMSATAFKKFDTDKGFLIYDINDMFLPNGKCNVNVNENKFYFPMWAKYQDTTRADVTDEHSKRLVPVFRIAEMYLIAIEAQAKLGNSTDAYNLLQTLATSRAIGNNGPALLSAYGITSGSNITDDFIIDERARELATEHLRFFDLKRFGVEKWLSMIKAGNPEAADFIKDFHYVRPIPQDVLDAVHNKDEFYQNPGYN